MTEAPGHPHNAARRTFVTDEGVTQPAPAPRFDRTPAQLPARAPRVGEHTSELLAAVGYTDAEIAALLDAGTVHQAKRPGNQP